MLRRDPLGEAVAECGGRGGRRVAAGAGARQGQRAAKRPRQRQLQLYEARELLRTTPIIVVERRLLLGCRPMHASSFVVQFHGKMGF